MNNLKERIELIRSRIHELPEEDQELFIKIFGRGDECEV